MGPGPFFGAPTEKDPMAGANDGSGQFTRLLRNSLIG
jgi:hypothetical protein